MQAQQLFLSSDLSKYFEIRKNLWKPQDKIQIIIDLRQILPAQWLPMQCIELQMTFLRIDLLLFIILLMQVQVLRQKEQVDPFDIIYNARSSRASRSRKSSISVIDKDKPRKTKKLRKMTLNPESIKYEEIKQIQELHQQKTAPHSERGDIKEQSQINIDDFLDLGWPKKMQSEKETELQSGIFVGIGSEKQLDDDFNWGRPVQKMDEEFQ